MRNVCHILKYMKIHPKYFYVYNMSFSPTQEKCMFTKEKLGKKSTKKKN